MRAVILILALLDGQSGPDSAYPGSSYPGSAYPGSAYPPGTSTGNAYPGAGGTTVTPTPSPQPPTSFPGIDTSASGVNVALLTALGTVISVMLAAMGKFIINLYRAKSTENRGFQEAQVAAINKEREVLNTQAAAIRDDLTRQLTEARDALQEAQRLALEKSVQNARLETRISLLEIRTRRAEVLTEQLESCVVTVNTNGLIVGCTSAIESILGYTAAELVNNNVTMLMEPQMEQKHAKAFAAVVAGQTELNTCPRLVLARHKNGNLVKIRIKICETKIEGARLFLAFIQPRAEDMTTDES